MIVLSIVIWIVGLYSLKVCFAGFPEYLLVQRAPADTLNDAAECLEQSIEPDDEHTYWFMMRFMRLTVLRFALFLAEIGIVWYLIYDNPSLWIPWAVLAKNMVMMTLGYVRSRQSGNVFDAIREMPPAMVLCERLSQLFSGSCFLYLFLRLNDLV